MEVNGPGSIQSPFPIQQPRPADVGPSGEARPVSPRDAVEISSAARMLESAGRSARNSGERLEQIRAAIEAGEYDTPEKLEAALERMFERLGIHET
jgi:negative regulator of flagellin synthesis FlgM